MKLRVLTCATAVAICAAANAAAAAADSSSLPLYRQAGAPIPARVTDLLSRMTVDEMIGQLTHWYSGSAASIKTVFGATGVGQVSMQSSLAADSPADTVAARNAFQAFFLNNSRLGIPVSVAHEGLHSGGLFGTVFPELCTTACSWNVSLAAAIGAAQADEARAHGVDNTFSPVVNLWGADARFGRYQEGWGPDPTLAAAMGTALLLGLQGGPQDQSNDYLPSFNTTVWATAKHYAGYGEAAGGLNGGEFVHNNRSLFEVYLRPWRRLVAVAGLRGVMPSHNTVLDVPMHAHRYLMLDVLRGEFGFGNGSAVSDCSDVAVLGPSGFGIAADPTVAAALGTLATVDLDLWCSQPAYYSHLNASLAAGLVTLADIQANVAHVLTQKIAAGLLDQPYTDPDWVNSRIATPAHAALALQAAEQGLVLLQNVNNTLPLAVPPGGVGYKIAMIGPHVTCNDSNDAAAGWFAAYSTSYGPLPPRTKAYAGCYGRANTLGSYTLDLGWISVPLLPDAWAAAYPNTTITVAEGAKIGTATPRPDLVAAAVAAAAAADVAVVALGDDLASCGEWADRDDLDLPGGQLALLQALVDNTTTPIVVVLVNGRAASFGPGNALLQRVAAVVEAWRPGQQGWPAVVNVLTGITNPSGKLTNQWTSGVGSIGSGASPWLARVQGKWIANGRSAPDANASEGRVYDGYVSSGYGTAAVSGMPLFRFGHGLSYTTYEYKSIDVAILSQPAQLPNGGVVSGFGRAGYAAAAAAPVLSIAVRLCNTGARDGTEVVQVYAGYPRGLTATGAGGGAAASGGVSSSSGGSFVGSALAPFWKRLLTFGRLPLPAGACGSLSLNVSAEELASYDDGMVLRVLPGDYRISAGGRSDQDTLQQNITLLPPPAPAATTSDAGRREDSPRDRLVAALQRAGRGGGGGGA